MSGEDEWVSAREALSWATAAVGDEWQALDWLRECAVSGIIGTRGQLVGHGEVSDLGPFFWVRWREEQGLLPPVESWETGRFEGWAPLVVDGEIVRRAASRVEFASEDLEKIYPSRRSGADVSRPRKGRPPLHAWPAAMAEFAAYVHENGHGDTAKAIKHVQNRLAKRGLEMGRETLRLAVLDTWKLIQAD